MARATLEGVALGLRALIEILQRHGPPVTELLVSGQAASLGSWNQIKADVTGVPVRRVPGDATAAGVAMLAGLGVGAYASPEQAVAAACRLAAPAWADQANREAYEALYQRYRAVLGSDLARPGRLGAREPGAAGRRARPGGGT